MCFSKNVLLKPQTALAPMPTATPSASLRFASAHGRGMYVITPQHQGNRIMEFVLFSSLPRFTGKGWGWGPDLPMQNYMEIVKG